MIAASSSYAASLARRVAAVQGFGQYPTSGVVPMEVTACADIPGCATFFALPPQASTGDSVR
jgi:hypothetical protein